MLHLSSLLALTALSFGPLAVAPNLNSLTSPPGPATSATPLCQVVINATTVRACGYIEYSDACCIEPLTTMRVQSKQRHLAQGMQLLPHTNVTIFGLMSDALYLVSHDDGCGPGHECWEVSPGLMGQLGPLETRGQSVEVRVSFLAGPKAYNVSQTTSTVSAGASRATGTESAECRLLRASTPVLDFVGQSATLRLVPPLDPEPSPPPLPGVNVTLHSDQCHFDCRNFKVDPHCQPGGYNRTNLYMGKPFEEVLIVPNVTLFNAAPTSSYNLSSTKGPLLFHCARMFLRGCVIATPTFAVRIRPPSVPTTVMTEANGLSDRIPTTGMFSIFALVCFGLVMVCAIRNLLRSDPRRPLTLNPVDVVADCKPEPPLGSEKKTQSTSRLLLVYYQPRQDGPLLRALSGAMRIFARLLSGDDRAQVVDMHDDHLMLEDGALLRASYYLHDPSVKIVFVLGPGLYESIVLLSDTPYHKFIAHILLGFVHAPDLIAGRLFTVSLGVTHHEHYLFGAPASAIYVMPYHLTDLLKDVRRFSPEESCQKKFQSDEKAFKRYIGEYIQLHGKSSVGSVV